MTQNERELLVEKYLSGGMNAAEESDFFINVALDTNLRQDLRAQQTLHRAFASDIRAAVPQQASYRSNIMALLASTQVIGGAGIGAGAGASGAASGSGAAGAGAAATAGTVATGSLLTKVILGTAVGLSLAGGTLYVTGQFGNSNQATTPNAAPVQHHLETIPPQLQPPTLQQPVLEQPTPPAQPQAASKPTKRSAHPASQAKQGGNSEETVSGDQVVTVGPATTTKQGSATLNK